MRILFYIHSLGIGGAEMLVTQYALKLKASGHHIVIVENDKQTSFLRAQVKAAQIPIYTLFRPFSATLIGRLKRYCSRLTLKHKWQHILQAEKPDIVHIHTVLNYYRPALFPLPKTVLTFHAEVPRALQVCGKKNAGLIARCAKKGMAFIAISKKAEADIKRIFKTENVCYIPNGVDMKRIAAQTYEKRDLLHQLQLPADTFIVGHVGRLHPVKNHEKVIGVFKEIYRQNPAAHLLLVGEGSAERVAQLKRLVAESGLTGQVRFLGVRQDAVAIESCMDVLLLPSFSESFSLVLIEAQVHRVRCVASTRVPEEVICNSNCLRLDLTQSDAEWAEAALRQDEQTTQKDLTVFDMEHVMNQTLDLYASLKKLCS